jgi:hypothetical protein
MEGKILVGLRPNDDVEEIIPYLERMAKPGMKVVCLIRYPLEPRNYLRDHWVTTDSTRCALAASRKVMDRYSWDAQKQRAKEKLAAVSRAMQKKAVDVEIDLYTGSLQTSVLDRTGDSDVRWVIIPAGDMVWSAQLLERAFTPFARFKWALFCCKTPTKTIGRPN